jgi:hypothetical protein
MVVVILFAIIILMGGVILMSIQVILKKDGRFPDMHIGNSRVFNEKGIYCAKTQDREEAEKKNLFDRLNLNR